MNKKQLEIYKVWREKKYKRDLEKRQDELASRGLALSGIRNKEEQWVKDELDADLAKAQAEADEFEDEKLERKKTSRNQRWTNLVVAATAFVAVVLGMTQNDISDRLLSLEEISREPVLLVSIDGALDNSGNFSGQIYLENAGPVPISNIKYGASDFNSGSWRTPSGFPTSTPVTNSDVFHKGTVHSMTVNHHGILAPGKEFSIPVWIEDLEIPNEIPSIWVGVTFTRHPDGPQRCVELNYIPLTKYQELPVYSSECGPWWTGF